MSNQSYDIICIGGGLGGAALANAMVAKGASVLILERERQFRDRVRGEALMPWGTAEARTLGIMDLLIDKCALPSRWAIGLGPDRELASTTPQALPILGFYHPAMQETLLHSAEVSGAQVRRGTVVRSVTPGSPAITEFETDGRIDSARARIVVASDGRSSGARRWGGFAVQRDPERMLLAGVLLEGHHARSDASYLSINPTINRSAFLTPVAEGRARCYLGYRADSGFRLNGVADLPRLIEGAVEAGMPAEYYRGTEAVGPLATFDGADSWVVHPYANGITLVGDAAATSDPIWGQGLSMTLRDVRILRDQLTNSADWDEAGHAYAREHDRSYQTIHIWEDWLTKFFYERGHQADERRARALPLIAQDMSRVPDYMLSGPDLPFDDSVRARFYGEL